MHLFRLVLLAVGVTLFLVVRFFADSGAPATEPEPLPPRIPEAVPVEAPNDPHPFLRMSPEVVFANIP